MRPTLNPVEVNRWLPVELLRRLDGANSVIATVVKTHITI